MTRRTYRDEISIVVVCFPDPDTSMVMKWLKCNQIVLVDRTASENENARGNQDDSINSLFDDRNTKGKDAGEPGHEDST